MNRPSKLSDVEIQSQLEKVQGWQLDEGKLFKEFRFKDFIQAWGFMSQAAILAQTLDHHPEWFNVYNKVRIHLNTHDVGGISQLDFDLAAQLDKLV